MPNSKPTAPDSIHWLSPSTDAEWHDADTLINELKAWDAAESQPLGLDAHEVAAVFYPHSIEDIRRNSVLPDGQLLLAMNTSTPVGCAAFRRLSADVCELYDVYVRPVARGRGVGSRLLQKLMSDARVAGYKTMRLETASFMRDAHKLYRSLHFHVREPYRSVEAKYADVTIWMECRLDR